MNAIKTFMCPSNAWSPNPLDPQGFGKTDYGATVYTDIDPSTGLRNKSTRANGALHVNATRPLTGDPVTAIADGSSSTIAIAEDVGRDERYVAAYIDPYDGQLRRFWRWAEPDNGFGVLTEIDVQATMRAKLQVDMPAYRILGACNPKMAYQAIGLEPRVGAMLPCNVILRAVPGGVEVSAIDPVASMQAIENAELSGVSSSLPSRK